MAMLPWSVFRPAPPPVLLAAFAVLAFLAVAAPALADDELRGPTPGRSSGMAGTLPDPAPGRVPDRALVLPFQPGPGVTYDGMGPAIQNVIENVLALNPALEETYLLRHMRDPFPTAWDLQAYMRGLRPHPFPMAGLAREGARYIISGYVLPGPKAEVRFLDMAAGTSGAAVLPICEPIGGPLGGPIDESMGGGDCLVGFKKGLLDFLARKAGLSFPAAQAAKAIRPEKTDADALRAAGLSYGAYMVDSYLRDHGRVALPLARSAVAAAPESYLARNMIAWQYFASGDLARAEGHFRTALKHDPDGVDALDGMMQCSYRLGGFDAAMPWGLRKAKARGADIGQPLSELHMFAGHLAMDVRKVQAATEHYKTAAALNPSAELPAMQLSLALEATESHDQAHAPLDALLSRTDLASKRARILNFKARLARWASRSHRQAGSPREEKRTLEQAVEFLRQSPVPDLGEYSLVLRRLAVISLKGGDPASAVRILELIRPEKNTDPLLVEAMLAHARAVGGQPEQAEEGARTCVARLAERARTLEPAPASAYEQLKEAFSVLGDERLAASMERQRVAGRER